MKRIFGILPDGKEVYLFTLKNSNGLKAEILNYGGIIQSLIVPDKNGNLTDVVLGFQTLEQYRTDQTYMGAIVGRFANRIEKGRFKLNVKTYQLPVNNGENCLHGGYKGFNKKVWKIVNYSDDSLELSYFSRDGEEGFPGNMTVSVIYSLTENNSLQIEYSAKTDSPTHINLTQHSYFNLSGSSENTIENHLLQINSSHYLPNNENTIPTGKYTSVENSPFDLQIPQLIGTSLASPHEQMRPDFGFNHTYILKDENSQEIKAAAILSCPENGISMKTYTSEPGIHIYCANYFDGSIIEKKLFPYPKYAGICLETQHFPDSPNQPHFPSTLLTPENPFKSVTVYEFDIF